jgi:hypothetical protein
MSLVQLAYGDTSGNGAGPLFTGSVSQLASLAWNVSIGNVSPSEIEAFVNPVAVQAEAGQPEGTQIELDITGWTFLGTDYSSTVAGYINQYWQSGEFTVNGETMKAWPGNSQVALGGGNTLTVRYVKGQIWILYVAVAIAIILGVLYIVQYLTGQTWSMSKTVGATSTGGGISGWWNSQPLINKLLYIGGLATVAIFGIMYYSRLSIAEAGAPKIEIGGGY